MAQHTQVLISMDRSRDTEFSNGQMEQITKGNGLRIICTVMESTAGQMVGNTLATGETMFFMAKAHTHGLMVKDMRASITMTKKKDSEPVFGQMESLTQEAGRMVNSMESQHSQMQKVRAEKESGKQVNARNGLKLIREARFQGLLICKM